MRLDEQLMRDAKALAAEEGKTFTALIEDSLRERLARSQNRESRERRSFPVSRMSGGLREGLDRRS